MQLTLYKEQERGSADYGWLKAKHSFSFANYYDPKKINFGVLRVLNDDIIKGGTGFGEHPHDNMEIITIPLKGSLKHKDSMSNKWISLNVGEVQVMSAGTGLQHAEMNNLQKEDLNLFQIWIIPNKQNITPRYNQKIFEESSRKNKLQTLVTSVDEKDKNVLKINQDAKISRIDLSQNNTYKYQIKSKNYGLYLMMINGRVSILDSILNQRDALAVTDTNTVEIRAELASEILFIEVPMNF